MAGRTDVVLVHPWLGELRRYRDDQLIGSVEIDPSVRVPGNNGDRDLEVLLHAAPALTGAALRAYADRCAKRISTALELLEPIKQFTVQHAPPGWAEHYAPRSATPAGLLFLDGIEAGNGDGAPLSGVRLRRPGPAGNPHR